LINSSERRDFPYWRGAISDAKTISILKSVGEDLAQFQSQSDFLGNVTKLTDGQVGALRAIYSERLKKLESEALDVKDQGKPQFHQ